MPTRIGGLASGIDTESIISQILQVERRPLERIDTSKKDLESLKGIWNEVDDQLSTFKFKLVDLTREAIWGRKKVVSGDEKVVTGSATNKVEQGAHSLVVKQLAKAHRVSSDQITAGAFSGTFRIEGVVITLNNAGLNEIASAINSSGASANASASLIDGRIVLESKKTGTENLIQADDLAADGVSVSDQGILHDIGLLQKTQTHQIGDSNVSVNQSGFFPKGNAADGLPNPGAAGSTIPDSWASGAPQNGTTWMGGNAQGSGDYLQIDLGEVKSIGTIRYNADYYNTGTFYDHVYQKHFEISGSIDGVSWTTVVSKDTGLTADAVPLSENTLAEDSSKGQLYEFEVAAEARYVRVQNIRSEYAPGGEVVKGWNFAYLSEIRLDSSKFKNTLQTPQDAAFSVDGLDVTRSSNSDIRDVIVQGNEFVAINLKGISSKDASGNYISTPLTVEHDTKEALDAVQGFATQYSSLMEFLDEKLKNELSGSSAILSLRSRLQLMVGGTVLSGVMGKSDVSGSTIRVVGSDLAVDGKAFSNIELEKIVGSGDRFYIQTKDGRRLTDGKGNFLVAVGSGSTKTVETTSGLPFAPASGKFTLGVDGLKRETDKILIRDPDLAKFPFKILPDEREAYNKTFFVDLKGKLTTDARLFVNFSGTLPPASAALWFNVPTPDRTNSLSAFNKSVWDPTSDPARWEIGMGGINAKSQLVDGSNSIRITTGEGGQVNPDASDAPATIGDVRLIANLQNPSTLAEIGIATSGKSAALSVEAEKLTRFLEDNPEAVKALFAHDLGSIENVSTDLSESFTPDGLIDTGRSSPDRGLAVDIIRFLDPTIQGGGVIDRIKGSLDESLRELDKRARDFESRLALREDTLRRQFTAMEEAIANSRALNSFLSSQAVDLSSLLSSSSNVSTQ